MFTIEEENERFFVIPTAEYVLERFNRFDLPYDTNWEIYRLFGFEPEEFIQYVIAAYDARVEIHYKFPWITFYFPSYVKAEIFKNELEKRS